MKNLILIGALFLNTNAFAACWDYRDDSGLKVCVNDKVMLIGDNRRSNSHVFEVIGLGADGIVGVKVGPSTNLYLSSDEYILK